MQMQNEIHFIYILYWIGIQLFIEYSSAVILSLREKSILICITPQSIIQTKWTVHRDTGYKSFTYFTKVDDSYSSW